MSTPTITYTELLQQLDEDAERSLDDLWVKLTDADLDEEQRNAIMQAGYRWVDAALAASKENAAVMFSKIETRH